MDNNNGFVALVTVMIMIIIFSIMIIAALQVAVDNRNYNLDDRLSEQAFLAAESGAEELIELTRQKLVEAAENGYDIDWVKNEVKAETCDIPAVIHSDHGSSSTSKLVPLEDNTSVEGAAFGCQTIDLEPNAILGSNGENESRTIELPERTHRLVITWTDPGGTSFSARGDNSNPRHSSWGSASAALIAQVFSVASSSNGNSEATTLIRPRNGGGNGDIGASQISADCQTSQGCRVELTVSSITSGAVGAFLRLTPIYKGAQFSVEAFDSSGEQLSFGGGIATVDSTGKAGDTWRRIQKQVEFGASSSDENYPTDGIYAGGNICKNFTFRVELDGGLTKVNGTECN